MARIVELSSTSLLGKVDFGKYFNLLIVSVVIEIKGSLYKEYKLKSWHHASACLEAILHSCLLQDCTFVYTEHEF